MPGVRRVQSCYTELFDLGAILTLFSRQGCHLCEDMHDSLREYETELNFSVSVVDIDGDAALRASYNELVPVLTHGNKEICRYFLDMVALRQALGTDSD